MFIQRPRLITKMDKKNTPIANKDPPISSTSPDEKRFEHVLENWKLDKDSISVEQFSRLLNYLCFNSYICRNEASFDHEKCERLSKDILDVWNTAPDELKMQYFHNRDYLDELFLGLKISIDTTPPEVTPWQPRVCYNHDVSFFVYLFSDMPFEWRSEVLHDYWRLLVARSFSDTLEKLINLCLVDPDKIRIFVETEMLDFTKIKTIVDSWSSRRLFYEVIDYSNLCTWNNQFVQEFRKRVFSVIVPSLEEYDSDKLLEVYTLIQSRLTFYDPKSFQPMKSYNFNNLQDLLVKKLEQGFSEVVFWMIERFTPTKRSPRERQTLLSHWHDFLATEEVDQDYLARWKEFSSWWECEPKNYPMFQQFLSATTDDKFQKLLLQVVQNLTLCLGPMEKDRAEPVPSQSIRIKEFQHVDEFLTDYLGTEIAAKNYKTNTLFKFREIAWLATLLDANNECLVNDLLNWFFNGDLYQIVDFKDNFIKKTYVNSEIPVESNQPSESHDENEQCF